MLPQKFSAATTHSTRDDEVAVVVDFPQPASTRVKPAASAVQRGGTRQVLMPRIIIRTILIATGRRMLAAMEQDLHATVAGRLRRLDQRYTNGRRALVEILSAAGRPVTIVEVLEGGTVPAQSTAYRNLAVLVQAGVVRKVFGGDDLTRYELAEELTEHHHHMVCVNCGSIEDFTVPNRLEASLDKLFGQVSEDTGFRPQGHRLDVIGTCGNCG
jgi:Fe2+ or Zn2+ uptake regulation protein